MKMVVSFFDVHHPDCNLKFWAAFLKLLSDLQKTCRENRWELLVVFGGDFGEWTSGNSHTPLAFRASYDQDIKNNRHALQQVRYCLDDITNIILMEGNHENMLLRQVQSQLPTMTAGYWERWARDMDFDRLGITWIPTVKQPLKIGKLSLLHGDQMGKFLPKHRAMAAALKYPGAGRVVIFGHGHVPQMFVQPGDEGNTTAYAAGCGRTLDPDWMRGAPAGWANELHVSLVADDDSVLNTPVVWNGCLVWGGKLYT